MHTCAIVLSYKYRCYIVKTIFFPTKWIKSELVSPLCEGNTYICRLEQWYIIYASFVSRVCLCILITACSNKPFIFVTWLNWRDIASFELFCDWTIQVWHVICIHCQRKHIIYICLEHFQMAPIFILLVVEIRKTNWVEKLWDSLVCVSVIYRRGS